MHRTESENQRISKNKNWKEHNIKGGKLESETELSKIEKIK